MKTKILGIVTMVTVLLMMLVSSVNAATITADKAEMTKEEIVTLTLTTETPVDSMQFNVKFDSTKFEYIADSFDASIGNEDENMLADGELMVAAYNVGNTSNKATLQFKALDNVENAEFTVSGAEFGVESVAIDETVTTPTVTVSVVEAEPTEDPDEPTEEPEDPTEEPDQKPDDEKPAEDPDKDDNGYYDEDGNPIEKLPQTGSMVPVVVAGVAILVVASLVVFKATRK